MNHKVSEKAYKGMGMEGFTARWYASLTHKSLDEFKSLARRVGGQIPAGASVLEVAPGPGYFAIELAKLGAYRVTGLDISRTLVEIARTKATQEILMAMMTAHESGVARVSGLSGDVS